MKPTSYEIVVRGHLGPRLERAIEGFEVVSHSGGNTHLTGWVVDQSSLQAAMRRVGDFGLELVSVRPVPDARTRDPDGRGDQRS